MNQRFAIGAPKWGPSCYAANREGFAKLSARSGSTPIWDRLNHKKVLPMCLGESVTYVLEHSDEGKPHFITQRPVIFYRNSSAIT
jgi:hypothetical protein